MLSTVNHPTFHQETRNKLFLTYIENNRNTQAVEAKFKAMLVESTKTSLRYGFRNEIWLRKQHGDRKAESIMKRKKELGLFLSLYYVHDVHYIIMYSYLIVPPVLHTFPKPGPPSLSTFPKAWPPIYGKLKGSVLRQGLSRTRSVQESLMRCFSGSWWNSTWMTSRSCEG